MEDTYLLFMRCPVYRRHDSHSGFRMELENLDGDDKGKGTSGDPTRLKVPMHRSGAHCLVGARKRGNARGAKVSSRQGCESSEVQVLVPPIACSRAGSISDAWEGNDTRSART